MTEAGMRRDRGGLGRDARDTGSRAARRNRSPTRCARSSCRKTGRACGFTLIELLVVLVLVALLAAIATPVVSRSIRHARESALKEDLFVLRKAIDHYYADAGAYPPDLEALVKKHYLRAIPVDPFTGRRNTWVEVPAQAADNLDDDPDAPPGVIDVHSGTSEKARDGEPYADW